MAAIIIVKDKYGNTVAQGDSGQVASIMNNLRNSGKDITGYQATYPNGQQRYYSGDGTASANPPQPTQPPSTTPTAPTTPTPPPGGNPVPPGTTLSTPDSPVATPTVPGTDISSYIPATSTQQQDIIKNALDQSRGVSQQNLADLNDLYHKNIIAQVSNWTDPNSSDYQSTMGQLNNVGRADQNTFGQSVSSRLAPLISQSLTNASTNALQPSFYAQQGLVGSGAANQSEIGLASLQRFMQQQDFTQQANLANQLADKGQPSSFQTGASGASSILNGLGNFGQGINGLKNIFSGGCFISTACFEAMGFPDDCDDLIILRYFRDTYVSPEDVKAYYRIAPAIVKAIDDKKVYSSIYKEMIKPCVRLIVSGYYDKAFSLYKNKTNELYSRYMA